MLTRGCQRTLVLVGAVLLCLTASPERAMADTNMELEFDDDSGSIDLDWTEELPGSPGGTGGGNDAAASGGSGEGDDGCQFIVVNPDTAPASLGPRPSDDHVLVGKACRGQNAGSVTDLQWVEQGADGALAIAPEVLAAQAVDNLQLPSPQIAASPESAQLVYLPVWLWLEGASWSSQSASASVPGLTVIARAVPAEARWDMGDGATVICDGPGTVWEQGMDPEATSPDCGHTYTQPSSDDIRTSVTVDWQVTWSGGGESGSVPGMVTTASVSWPVIESHALVTR